MSLSADEVKAIAHLARLSISDAEVDGYARELSHCLDLLQQINEANTDGVVEMSHSLDMVQRLRSDDVTESDQRDVFLDQAPAAEAGLFLVPRVIE
ncbi:MAG: Asp-tRNA(Asn)/Glu-tRNA(Gln) amidotransferase subunit GatC [Pseudomonadota bacterium]|nr:Asp-tRNA(Asn)/Glu-tRNA(Gln) amidotransferase subunit GatC [Pseudomonadota bacterium]